MPFSSPSTRRRLSAASLSLAVAVLSLTSASAQTAKAAKAAMMSTNVAVPSVVKEAQASSRLAGSTILQMTISLAPANRSGLTAFANSVSDPKSENFRRFLTPKQIGERFGVSDATVNTVVSYLKGKGMKVTMVGDSRTAIVFSGRADKVESAFATKLYNYSMESRATAGPLKFFSNATPPMLPGSIATKVAYIEGLDNANPPMKRFTPLSPSQGRRLYNLDALFQSFKGEGINIAVTNLSDYRLSNTALFYQTFGLPQPVGGYGSNITKIIIGGVDGETLAQDPVASEGDLDFQLVLGAAPLCNLFIYDGSGAGLIAILAKEAQDNLADIVTESYGFGGPTSFYVAAHDQHLIMSAQGITYMGASGDNGTKDLNSNLPEYLGLPYPDFDPDVLMVGGTEATVDGAGNRTVEFGWDGSGSGWYPGDVPFNVLPPYQTGPGIPTNINKRLVPDIALQAVGGGWQYIFKGARDIIGGTSAATPSFAGQLGVVLQALAANGGLEVSPGTRPRLGRIQDSLYGYYNNPSLYATSFFDVLGGNAGVLPDGSQSVGKPGWDFVTGIGAPNGQGLYNAFFTNASEAIFAAAGSVGAYTLPRPVLTLGTDERGNAGALSDADGVLYSLQSVRQSGLGQAVAAKMTVSLQTARQRRAASVRTVLSIPTRTTGYVYLLNNNTGRYDLVQTITGTGPENATNASLKLVDVTFDATSTSPYVSGNSVTMLVRAIKPSRFGSSSFRLTLDQAGVVERVAR